MRALAVGLLGLVCSGCVGLYGPDVPPPPPPVVYSPPVYVPAPVYVVPYYYRPYWRR
jgi:hypothetical protein